VLDEGVPLETAVAESKVIGLRTEELLDKARRYIRRKQINRKPGVTAKPLVEDDMVDETPPEASGSPPLQSQDPASRGGINDAFVNPDLNVDEFVKRFEIESREIYASRDAVMAACQVKPGERIADVGAGTGLYTRLFATAVGEGGWVYAIDIAPRFIEHINVTARDAGLENVTGIVNSQSSINLPPQSVDLVFICDTYHHFEAPEKILASISRALKPGGQLVLIDFERVPGTSREWVVSHVRAGREVFRGEIEAAGLEFVEQRAIPGFSENYFLRFVKK
jgi:ubiquinone/menaquinone biosynthesis C-methylase UbiE